MLITAHASAAKVAADLPKPFVPDGLGVNIHFTGKQEAQVKKIAEGGFKLIRMDFSWQRTESTVGQYNFKPYDELFSSLADHGIRPLMILDYGNQFYDGGLAPYTDEGRAAFVSFVEATASRYKGKGIIWEIWNEPNHPTFWKPFPNAQDYVRLAEAVSRAIRKSDPEATIIGPALSAWDFAFLESLFKLGLLKHLDAVSVHPYGSAKPEDAFAYYERVRALIRKYAPNGRDIPIVSGEWGYASAKGFTLERQAQFIAREFLVNLMSSIPLSIWYDWRNDGQDPDDPEHNCGVVDFGYAEKPAFRSFQTLAKELKGFRFAARIDYGSDDDYLALFVKGKETCLAAWTTGRNHKLQTLVDVDGFVVTSSEGEKTELSARDGKLELNLTASPVYVKPLQASRRWLVEAGWKVSATPTRKGGSMSLQIVSEIPSELPHYEFFIRHYRLPARRTKLDPDSRGGSLAQYTAPYVSNAEPKNRIKVVARILGLLQPLTRTVEFEDSACPSIQVLPPTDTHLLIAVAQPDQGSSPEFSGTLQVSNYQGIKLEYDSVPVKLEAGPGRRIVRFKMTQLPAGIYSFSCGLADGGGAPIAKLPAERYSLVETFSRGNPGDAIGGFKAVLGGDPKALGEATLTYAESPEGAPARICGRLDYRVDAGWKYVQIVPQFPLRIPERPRFVRIWVKGEGNNLPISLRYVGSDRQFFQQNYGRLESSEWQVFEGDLSGAGIYFWGAASDGIVRYPLSWDSLLLVDNTTKIAATGTVYVGPAMICLE